MIRRLVNLILLYALSMNMVVVAQTISSYEYWFDDDYAGRATQASTAEEIKFSVDASELSWGLHTFFFRTINSLEEKSAPMNRWVYLFDKAEVLQTNLSCYEYWIDNDYEHRVNGSLSGDKQTLSLDISTEGLTQDMHLLHMRFSNMDGAWSETKHYVFYNLTAEKPADPTKVTTYEYWFDNDYTAHVTKQFSASFLMFEADLSALDYGLHFMHLRIKNDIDEWSSPKSFMLYTIAPTPEEPDLAIVGYRYAFNEQVTFVPFKGSYNQSIIAEFETPDVLEICPIDETCTFTVSTTEAKLSRTAHIDFQLQFLNADGNWGMPISKDYTEDVEVTHSFESMTVDKVFCHQKALKGDFFATSITLQSGPNYSLSADQPCTFVIYNRRGSKLGSYDLVPGENVNLAMGATIYCLVYNTTKDDVYKQGYIRILMSSDENEIIEPLRYDINQDGVIDYDDVSCLKDILLGRSTEGLNLDAADVSNDNRISIADLVALLNYISQHTDR